MAEWLAASVIGNPTVLLHAILYREDIYSGIPVVITEHDQLLSLIHIWQLIEAGVPKDIAAQDACRLEHVISEQSFQKLKEAAFSGSREVIPSDES